MRGDVFGLAVKGGSHRNAVLLRNVARRAAGAERERDMDHVCADDRPIQVLLQSGAVGSSILRTEQEETEDGFAGQPSSFTGVGETTRTSCPRAFRDSISRRIVIVVPLFAFPNTSATTVITMFIPPYKNDSPFRGKHSVMLASYIVT